jgi:hypothetical protein
MDDLAPEPDTLIWGNRDDTFLDASRLANELDQLAPRAGIPRHIRPTASVTPILHLAANRVDAVTIKKRMGWSTIKLLTNPRTGLLLEIRAPSQLSTRSPVPSRLRRDGTGAGRPRTAPDRGGGVEGDDIPF